MIQRRTVDHAFHRLFEADDSAGRFLVADEVGLGKTWVARGIIARTIDYLWDEVKRLDIVYICSTASIARANLALRCAGMSAGVTDDARRRAAVRIAESFWGEQHAWSEGAGADVLAERCTQALAQVVHPLRSRVHGRFLREGDDRGIEMDEDVRVRQPGGPGAA